MTQNNPTIEQLLADDSFVRWMEDRASENEKRTWEKWIQKDPARKELVCHAKRVHRGFKFKGGQFSESEIVEELRRLHSSIDEFELNVKQPEVLRRGNSKKSKGNYPAVAAGILILIAALSVLHLFFQSVFTEDFSEPNVTEVLTRYGEKKILSLSDGSRITLNSNSRLKYAPDWNESLIEFWLEGEAYFEILPEGDNKFGAYKIFTDDGLVEVVGTTFNVNTFPEGTEVALEEGEVRVEVGGLKSSGTTFRMSPGEWSKFSYEDELFEKSFAEVSLFTSWTHDKLIFDQTKLRDIADRIEQIYGVQFLMDSELLDIKISGSVPNDNLPVLIKSLQLLLNREITYTDNIIRID